MSSSSTELPPVSKPNDKNSGQSTDDVQSSAQNKADGQGARSSSSGGFSSSGNNSSPTIAGSSPQIADDVDLIEKEWVEKAKEIVEKTKENPYLQNKAISEIKADYIQKRYNKQVIKSEE